MGHIGREWTMLEEKFVRNVGNFDDRKKNIDF